MNNIYAQRAMLNEKSFGVTILLFIFLGIFGAHRFYTQGITLYNCFFCLTSGYFLIGYIVDFFLVWNMAQKVNDCNFDIAKDKDILEAAQGR